MKIEPDTNSTDRETTADPSQTGDVPPPEDAELSPEEQMQLYEDHLKETDWGHQPC